MQYTTIKSTQVGEGNPLTQPLRRSRAVLKTVKPNKLESEVLRAPPLADPSLHARQVRRDLFARPEHLNLQAHDWNYLQEGQTTRDAGYLTSFRDELDVGAKVVQDLKLDRSVEPAWKRHYAETYERAIANPSTTLSLHHRDVLVSDPVPVRSSTIVGEVPLVSPRRQDYLHKRQTDVNRQVPQPLLRDQANTDHAVLVEEARRVQNPRLGQPENVAISRKNPNIYSTYLSSRRQAELPMGSVPEIRFDLSILAPRQLNSNLEKSSGRLDVTRSRAQTPYPVTSSGPIREVDALSTRSSSFKADDGGVQARLLKRRLQGREDIGSRRGQSITGSIENPFSNIEAAQTVTKPNVEDADKVTTKRLRLLRLQEQRESERNIIAPQKTVEEQWNDRIASTTVDHQRFQVKARRRLRNLNAQPRIVIQNENNPGIERAEP